MTWEELEKVEAFLKENGYRKGDYPMHCNSDYYWWKSFGKDCNHYEEGRSLYQVLLNVYDWRKYWDRDPSLRKFNKAASITATISGYTLVVGGIVVLKLASIPVNATIFILFLL